MFGFTINLLTLFALLLAIGIVVDDAIVVVEAVHAKLDQGYTSALTASEDAMSEITSAIIAITLVMAAVFVPVSFITGSAGVFYKQFGLTLAIAIILSAVNALTLSPALAALFLKPHKETEKKKKNLLQRFYAGFNRGFDAVKRKYEKSVAFLSRRKWLAAVIIAVFGGLLYFLMKTTPTAFVPNEDMGVVMADVAVALSAFNERTQELTGQVEKIVRTIPEVANILRVNGTGLISGAGSNYGLLIIKLKPWDQRKDESQHVQSIIPTLFAKTSGIRDARIVFFGAPTLQGFGISSGFEFQLQDKTAGTLRLLKVGSDFLAPCFKACNSARHYFF